MAELPLRMTFDQGGYAGEANCDLDVAATRRVCGLRSASALFPTTAWEEPRPCQHSRSRRWIARFS